MEWIAYAIIALIAAVAAFAMQQQKIPETNQDQPNAPSAKDGDPYMVVFGRVWVKSAKVSSWGDIAVEEIKKKG